MSIVIKSTEGIPEVEKNLGHSPDKPSRGGERPDCYNRSPRKKWSIYASRRNLRNGGISLLVLVEKW